MLHSEEQNNPRIEDVDSYIVKSSIKEGIPNSLLTGDYYILISIIKNCLIALGNDPVTTASAYFTVYFSLLLHTVNYALIDAQGILGSQHIGEVMQKKACLRLKQSIFLGLFLFIFSAVLPSFFYERFLFNFLDLPANVSEISQRMVIWSLPGMALRTISDCLKTFLQNHKRSVNVGYSYLLLLIFTSILTFILINLGGMKEESVGVILFFYEFFGLIICLFFLWGLRGTEYLDFSLEYKTEFKLFIKNFINFYFVDFPGNFVFESQNFLVTLTHSNAQIMIYSILSSLIFNHYSLNSGFVVNVRTMLNRAIGEKDFVKVKNYLGIFKNFFLKVALIFSIGIIAILSLLELVGVYGEKGSEKRSLMAIIKWTVFVRFFINTYFCFASTTLKSVRKASLVIYFYSVPYFASPVASFLVGIYLDWGVIGIAIYEVFQLLYIVWVLMVFNEEERFVEFAEEYVKVREEEKLVVSTG